MNDPKNVTEPRSHAQLMDKVYRRQRHFYDLTRKYYLLGRDRLVREMAVRDGESVVEIELRPDGQFRYRSLDGTFDGRGTWGYARPSFYFRIDRLDAGDWEHRGAVNAWQLAELTDQEMTFDVGRERHVYTRPGVGPERKGP